VREKFIIRQPPIREKDDYDSENSWISDGSHHQYVGSNSLSGLVSGAVMRGILGLSLCVQGTNLCPEVHLEVVDEGSMVSRRR